MNKTTNQSAVSNNLINNILIGQIFSTSTNKLVIQMFMKVLHVQFMNKSLI
jgi:hypothetical protein